MMTLFHFETTVLNDGTLAVPLPEEFRGSRVDVVLAESQHPALPKNNDEFRRKKTLAEISAEQGGPKICTNPEDLSKGFPRLWDTMEELEEFLERRKY